MRPLFTILWCAALMAYGVNLMFGLYIQQAPLFSLKTAMDMCYLALFAATGGIVLFAFLGVFRASLLWGSILCGCLSGVTYLAMAARQDTPEHAMPTFLTLILCTVTWAFVREPGPTAFNLAEES